MAHVVDLLKKERGDFGSAKPAAERERDDGGVALRADVAVGLGGLEKTSRLGGLEGRGPFGTRPPRTDFTSLMAA